jgi:hypothetical protein
VGGDIGTWFGQYYYQDFNECCEGGSILDKQTYEIRVEGWLGDRWKSWFEGLSIRHLECGHTLLEGSFDQARLRGILTKISDLGLILVSVQRSQQDKSPK